MRIKQAWLALCGRLKPEVREVVREVPVPGEAVRVKLYHAAYEVRYWMEEKPAPKWNGNIYLTCEQAHSECPGAKVTAHEAIKVGDVYFSGYTVNNVQPKPKITKGVRKS